MGCYWPAASDDGKGGLLKSGCLIFVMFVAVGPGPVIPEATLNLRKAVNASTSEASHH